MQAQHRDTTVNRQRAPHVIKPSARAIAKQASLNKFDIVPKMRHKRARIHKSESSVAPTSVHETPQNKPVTEQAVQSAQSHTQAQMPESNDSESTPAIQQEVPDSTYDACNVASKQFDAATVVPQFELELAELANLGKKTSDAINDYHGKIQKAAIDSLGKCLGFRQKYFKIDDLEITDKLYAALYKKAIGKEFKKKAKNTTEYHLISRVFRGDDRRQASSDAQILIRANREGITEQTFSAWVLKETGLDAIKRKIAKERREHRPPKKDSVIQRQAGERLHAALLAAGQAKILKLRAHVEVMELEKISPSLVPDDGYSLPVVIRREADGAVTIHSFKLHGFTKESTVESTSDDAAPDEESPSV
jgi:hypothetical protein